MKSTCLSIGTRDVETDSHCEQKLAHFICMCADEHEHLASGYVAVGVFVFAAIRVFWLQ